MTGIPASHPKTIARPAPKTIARRPAAAAPPSRRAMDTYAASVDSAFTAKEAGFSLRTRMPKTHNMKIIFSIVDVNIVSVEGTLDYVATQPAAPNAGREANLSLGG